MIYYGNQYAHILTMDNKLFIPLVLGTNRSGNNTAKAARWLFAELGKRPEIETRLFDVRDFDMPHDDYGQALKDRFPDYRDAVVRSDGLVLVMPEYNHGMPGSLKSVLDLLLPEYKHKAVGLVGVSMGPWGGVRVIENAVPVARELGLIVTARDLHFPAVQNIFTADGAIQPAYAEAYAEQTREFLDELVWMARTLRWGRGNLAAA